MWINYLDTLISVKTKIDEAKQNKTKQDKTSQKN